MISVNVELPACGCGGAVVIDEERGPWFKIRCCGCGKATAWYCEALLAVAAWTRSYGDGRALRPLSEESMRAVNPGIRRSVIWLRSHGFDTCDSGDGETHDFECDQEGSFVALRVEPAKMAAEADRLAALLATVKIPVVALGPDLDDEDPLTVNVAASYDPADGIAVIQVSRLHDRLLPEQLP